MSLFRKRFVPPVALAACATLALGLTPAAAANTVPDGPALAKQLVKKVGVDGVNRHLIALQRIADTNGGNRAASTDGHKKSAEYIATKLEAAGLPGDPPGVPLHVLANAGREAHRRMGANVPVIAMEYTPSTPVGGITAPLSVVAVDDTSGCEATDYTADVAGKIALIKRGGCSFAQKQATAAAAGAIGAIVYNNTDGDLNGTLGDPAGAKIPTGGVTAAAGAQLATLVGQPVTLELRAFQEARTSYNVIAETKSGRKDNVVMLGSHLDSVPATGINDNGSGSATLLETALQLGSSPKVNNAVRFGFWSAEEFGLIGSTYYVDSLSFEQQLDIALYLNFDMIGSPNAGYFAYDGDDSDGVGAGPGPYGSAQIEKTLVDYLQAARGVSLEGTDFTGRSDYGEFIAVGIPAGGLDTGAEVLKTPAQAAKWGGTAGIAFDPCYHQACDNLGNIDRVALDRNADGVAWALGVYATSTESINGVKPGKAKNVKQKAAERSGQRNFSAHAVAGDPHALTA